MSINALLGTGLSALLANQAALRTTASNISNVNTPDYVRRVVGFKTQAPGGVLGGVDLGAVTRAVDLFLNAERLNASSGAGESDAADRFLDQLQKAMGGVAEGRDPASRLAAVTEGLAQLATDPASAAMQADFVQKLKSFAQGVADLGNRVQELRAQADGEIGTTIARVNTLTARIAELNVPIQHATLGGNSSSVLRDERDAALRELAGLIEVRVDEDASGRVSVTTPTGYTLVSDSAAVATHNDIDRVSAETVFAEITTIRRNSSTGDQIGPAEPLERHVTGGALRALLDLRDVTLPNIGQQIGALAAGAAEAMNAASNASSSWPAPGALTGRDTGLLAGDALNFSGKTSVAVVDPQGKLVRRIDVDFTAGTMTVDGVPGPATGTTVGSFVTALNTALTGVGTATFANGVLSMTASGGNGVAISQDATAPSSRAGRGFAHTFGLNDILQSSVPTSFATGLTGADAHGFTAGQQVEFGLRDAKGVVSQSFTYTVAGATVADVVTGLNAAAGSAGSFALNADGSIGFTPAGGSTQRLEILGDGTVRGSTSLSLTEMFGIGQRFQMAQATGLTVKPSLAARPSLMPLAQLDLGPTTAIGDVVLASADNKGALALQAAGGNLSFAAAGFAPAQTNSLSGYASALVAAIGQRAAAASDAALDAKSLKAEVQERASSKEGVNLDEELANMMIFQRGYNAGARLISIAQQLYDELLNMVR
ncbi:MAG: flagellar hook-associated protein FlgK [Alphaproteobacteria bacterium]